MCKMLRICSNCEKMGTMLRAIALSTLILAAFLSASDTITHAELSFEDRYYPVEYKCAGSNGGRTELLSANRAGTHILVVGGHGVDAFVEFRVKEAGQKEFKSSFHVLVSEIGSGVDEKLSKAASKLVDQTTSIESNVCNANADDRRRYDEMLKRSAADINFKSR